MEKNKENAEDEQAKVNAGGGGSGEPLTLEISEVELSMTRWVDLEFYTSTKSITPPSHKVWSLRNYVQFLS